VCILLQNNEMMKKIITILVSCLLALPAFAQGELLTGKDAQDAVAQITAAHSSLSSIKSDFVQSKISSLIEGEVVQRGKFSYTYPDQIIWEYTYPNKLKINFNDKSNKMAAQLRGVIVNTINGSNLTDNKNFKPSYYKNQDGSLEVVLKPINKRLRSMYKSITISLDKQTDIAKHISFAEVNGDMTDIKFTNQEVTRK
jgi:outer membrane lipoprotein-sorting protein